MIEINYSMQGLTPEEGLVNLKLRTRAIENKMQKTVRDIKLNWRSIML